MTEARTVPDGTEIGPGAAKIEWRTDYFIHGQLPSGSWMEYGVRDSIEGAEEFTLFLQKELRRKMPTRIVARIVGEAIVRESTP